MLWVAVHLPLLSLESFAATLPAAAAQQPLALIDAHRIVSANAAAQQLGVKPGLKRATALALAPHLTLAQADARRDEEALRAVAHTALAFTPSVTIQPANDAVGADRAAPDTVLLEVQGSLRYFGGLQSLLQRLQRALVPLGHSLHLANAPTALGAALLARVHRRFDGVDLALMQRTLDAAPVWLLGPGRAHWEALQGMGLRTLADLRCLPRSGVARRFSAALLDELDRAYGAVPDPRISIVLPPAFESRLELFARADTTEQVLHGAGLLLDRLIAWLAAQHAFVRRFTLVMQHERVQCLAAVDDHRPELATVVRPADAQALCRAHATAASEPATAAPRAGIDYDNAEPAPGVKVRPVWLLNEGEPLQERDSWPLIEGQPLQLLSGPERIESGWWDMRLVERDYFVAVLPDGALVWIYRTRQLVSNPRPGWFLQGRFG